MSVFAWLLIIAGQSAYGPPVPVAPPAAPTAAVEPRTNLELVLRAQGMSEDGLRALHAIPMPEIARGATRAAQCAVEQLRDHDPLSVADLVVAMDERDATAAAQAQARTRYLAAALPALNVPDQHVLLAVVGDDAAIGDDAPPRPAVTRPGATAEQHGSGERRGRGGGGGFGGHGGGGMAGGPASGGAGRSGEGRGARHAGGPPAGAIPANRGPVSPCDRYLAD